MKDTPHRVLWVLLALAVLLGFLWQFFPIPDSKERLEGLPLKGELFSGKDEPLNDVETKMFKGANVIKRVYDIQGEYVFLTIVDGTNNRHVVHDPFYCFKGAGWELLSEKQIPIEKGHAVLYDMKLKAQTKQALVWFSDGVNNYTSPLKYWIDATIRRLTLGYSGEEPVLIIIQPIGRKTLDYEKIMKNFPEIFKV